MSKSETEEVLQRLYARHTFGIKLGLHVEESFLQCLGHPEKTFPVIHVAGTNGKGSVCMLMASILQSAGLRTGLYTSPHLVRFNERICVNGRPITDEDLMALVASLDPLSSLVARETGQEPTFFEYTTALAFEYFRKQRVQVAVVETGMGGRLDATNVVMPLASVITRVSLEHTAYLGKDIRSIAGEKAGIIKSGRPVICGATVVDARDMIVETARRCGAPVMNVEEIASASLRRMQEDHQKVSLTTADEDYGTFSMGLVGRHQVENLCTAVVAMETVSPFFSGLINRDNIRQGVDAARWPGRFHCLGKEPVVILDGAHNPGAAVVLADSLERVFKGRPVGLILGMCGDKDARGFVQPLTEIVKRAWLVPVASDRNMDPDLLGAAVEFVGWPASRVALRTALGEAKLWAMASGGVVCVTGSLFLVGEVLAQQGWRMGDP